MNPIKSTFENPHNLITKRQQTRYRDGNGNNNINQYGGSALTPSRIDSAAIRRTPITNTTITNRYNTNQREQQQQQQQVVEFSDAYNNPLYSDDNMEYYIKFPKPNDFHSNGIGLDDEMDVILPPEDQNVPIVMLLGWAGCQDRYLIKYSKIYEDRGLITVRYTAPVENLFWKRSAMIPTGEKILKLICDMNLNTHPVIFHIFSNGGAYLYQHISLAMHKHKLPVQVRGMIFDSAPGERRMVGLYRAVTAIYGKEKKNCNCFIAIIITLTLSVMWCAEETFAAFKSLFRKSSLTPTNPFNNLKNEQNKCPQMFIYSKGDIVIPYQDVEKFIRIRRDQGVEVQSVCFEDAEHVKIYAKYPSQYIQCICKFINYCLAIPYKSANVSFDTNSTNSLASNSMKYE